MIGSDTVEAKNEKDEEQEGHPPPPWHGSDKGREKDMTSNSLKGIKVRATGGQKITPAVYCCFTVRAKETS